MPDLGGARKENLRRAFRSLAGRGDELDGTLPRTSGNGGSGECRCGQLRPPATFHTGRERWLRLSRRGGPLHSPGDGRPEAFSGGSPDRGRRQRKVSQSLPFSRGKGQERKVCSGELDFNGDRSPLAFDCPSLPFGEDICRFHPPAPRWRLSAFLPFLHRKNL